MNVRKFGFFLMGVGLLICLYLLIQGISISEWDAYETLTASQKLDRCMTGHPLCPGGNLFSVILYISGAAVIAGVGMALAAKRG